TSAQQLWGSFKQEMSLAYVMATPANAFTFRRQSPCFRLEASALSEGLSNDKRRRTPRHGGRGNPNIERICPSGVAANRYSAGGRGAKLTASSCSGGTGFRLT